MNLVSGQPGSADHQVDIAVVVHIAHGDSKRPRGCDGQAGVSEIGGAIVEPDLVRCVDDGDQRVEIAVAVDIRQVSVHGDSARQRCSGREVAAAVVDPDGVGRNIGDECVKVVVAVEVAKNHFTAGEIA